MDPATLLKKYQDEGYNILTPSITLEGLSEHHRATVETILLSADKDVGDVYPHKADNGEGSSKSKFRISKQGLDKLAVLAGIIWHLDGGTERIDDRKDRDYVAYRAFGAIKKADGQLVPMSATYDLDLIVVEDDIRAQYEAKARKYKKDQDYVDFCVDRDMRSKRKHRATLCESGARNRVIRSLLGLKKVYTGAELSKPFVVVRITYQPDYNDPEVKRLVTLASIGAQSNIYGMQPQIPPPLKAIEYPEVEDEGDPDEDGETIDTEPNGVDTEPDGTPTEEFKNWDRKSRELMIGQMAKNKSYDLNGMFGKMENVSSLSELNDGQLNKLFEKLTELKPQDDDIPF